MTTKCSYVGSDVYQKISHLLVIFCNFAKFIINSIQYLTVSLDLNFWLVVPVFGFRLFPQSVYHCEVAHLLNFACVNYL